MYTIVWYWNNKRCVENWNSLADAISRINQLESKGLTPSLHQTK